MQRFECPCQRHKPQQQQPSTLPSKLLPPLFEAEKRSSTRSGAERGCPKRRWPTVLPIAGAWKQGNDAKKHREKKPCLVHQGRSPTTGILWQRETQLRLQALGFGNPSWCRGDPTQPRAEVPYATQPGLPTCATSYSSDFWASKSSRVSRRASTIAAPKRIARGADHPYFGSCGGDASLNGCSSVTARHPNFAATALQQMLRLARPGGVLP
eukprot:scaffold1293_cov262-Pinguiococcus_pyrenoidosus.AAC.2